MGLAIHIPMDLKILHENNFEKKLQLSSLFLLEESCKTF